MLFFYGRIICNFYVRLFFVLRSKIENGVHAMQDMVRSRKNMLTIIRMKSRIYIGEERDGNRQMLQNDVDKCERLYCILMYQFQFIYVISVMVLYRNYYYYECIIDNGQTNPHQTPNPTKNQPVTKNTKNSHPCIFNPSKPFPID